MDVRSDDLLTQPVKAGSIKMMISGFLELSISSDDKNLHLDN